MPDEIFAGIDEAGRGAVAGPVVAGACVIHLSLRARKIPYPSWSVQTSRHSPHVIIADSKLLSPSQRDAAFEWIEEHCSIGVGIASSSVVERKGILAATERAMQLAVAHLAETLTPTFLLVDGRDLFSFRYPHETIIGGDRSQPSIAAASIVAKVMRDRIMKKEHLRFPQYGFDRHKGYGTPQHIENLLRHGTCKLHRVSFLSKLVNRSVATHGGRAPKEAIQGR